MRNVKKVVGIILVVFVIGAGLYFNHEKNIDVSKFSYYEYFDTFIEISIYEDVNDESIEDKVRDRLSSLNEMADIFNDYESEGLYDLNANKRVDNEELAKVIQYSIDSYNNYSTQFNIALGPVIDIWKKALDDCNELGDCYVPTYEQLKSAGNTDANDIVVDGSVVEIQSDMKVDLGSVMKGYVSDEIANLLNEEGYEHFLINAGGNIYVTTKPSNENYSVGVVDPVNNSESFITFALENRVVVTSGDYERFYEVDGKRYSHLINSETLYPSTYFHSVTIICEKGIDGDILSTMLFGMEYEDGLELIESIEGADAIWYDTQGEVYKSSGIGQYEKN